MARFVSQIKGFHHGVQNATEAHLGLDGRMVPAKRELEAVFSHNLTTAADLEEAKARMSFRGLMQLEDGEPYGANLRVSVWDSEIMQLQNGYSDEEIALIVSTLRGSPFLGRDFIELLPVASEKPWRGYDDQTDPERIVELALAIDADLQKVIAYERENRNSPQVLAALVAALDAVGETVTVSA